VSQSALVGRIGPCRNVVRRIGIREGFARHMPEADRDRLIVYFTPPVLATTFGR